MSTATTPPPSLETGGPTDDPTAIIRAAAQALRRLADRDWPGIPGDGASDALVALEDVTRAVTALQGELINASEGGGLWAQEGHHNFVSWYTSRTGTTRATSARSVKLSRTLRDFLPRTREALKKGTITRDHAEIIARKCTATEQHRTLLLDEDVGEAFLVASAKELHASQFSKVADKWAVMADPEAADRGWREASAQEEVFLSPTTGGYLLSGWLSPVNGQLLEEALTSHMGRKAADDLRSPRQRRAEALTSLARYSLENGAKLGSARIRPHLTITMGYETLERLAQATTPAIDTPSLFPEWALSSTDGVQPDWMANWVPGANHVISTGIDYEVLRRTNPATLADGTPLPPGALSQLTCESMLARVVFGPDSTVLDSGREERIFPAHQVRAIIARDKHCQYPGCDAPPGFGEIHHSAEWFKHNGSTHVDLGILLCWHHHSHVHLQSITIFRVDGAWQFWDRTGRQIIRSDHTWLEPPGPEPPPF